MKTLSGALIPYGSTLPDAINTPDGALFYKTNSVGANQGLYLYGLITDSNSGLLGNQIAQGWTEASSPDLFVLKAGDTMTGALTVPATLSVTQASGIQSFLMGNQNGAGTNKPVLFRALDGVLSIGTGSSWSTSGGALTPGLGISTLAGTSGLTWQGGQVWHVGNDGDGSALDADLLDGQHGSFYQNASNINAGTLAPAYGGSGLSAVVPGAVVYGGASNMAFTAVGTASQVLRSGGAGAPTWVSQSAMTVGNATNANYAATAGTATTATNCVLKAGDTMTGTLAMGANNITVGPLTIVGASGSIQSTGTIQSTNSIVSGNPGVTGQARLLAGGVANTGYIDFYSPGNVRQGYIGYGSGVNLNYWLENGLTNHAFQGSTTATGNVTAYSSDGRLKKNLSPIQDAVQKVVSLVGYAYDWDMVKCEEVGFVPEREHEHGLIAQDVEKVLPDAVAPAPFDNRYKTVRYERVVALLTAAISEQQEQLTAQQEIIDALMTRMLALEAK